MNILVDLEQRRQFRIGKGLRRLLSANRPADQDRQRQDRGAEHFHSGLITERHSRATASVAKTNGRRSACPTHLSFRAKSRNLSLWNSRKIRFFSAPIRRRELSPLSWAKAARFAFTAGKQMNRPSPTSSRSIRSSGLTATLSTSVSKPKNSRAISITAG